MNNKNLVELESLLSGYWLSDLANFSAYVFEEMSNINWAGFYLSDGKRLRLGPFCGKVACLEIPFDKGVCGQAFTQNLSLIVDDVDKYAGHIRCDSRSKSELVSPLIIQGRSVGVFDIDSPVHSRFNFEDKSFFETALFTLGNKISTFSGLQYGSVRE
ncbi:MAG: GAF domain-containing protein [Bdellovibrionales bacterium]